MMVGNQHAFSRNCTVSAIQSLCFSLLVYFSINYVTYSTLLLNRLHVRQFCPTVGYWSVLSLLKVSYATLWCLVGWAYWMYFFFLRRSFTLIAQAGVQWCVLSYCNLHLLGSSDSPASASRAAEITGSCHHPANFVFLVETRFLHVGQAGLQLLVSSDFSTLASQSTRITGVSHLAWPT